MPRELPRPRADKNGTGGGSRSESVHRQCSPRTAQIRGSGYGDCPREVSLLQPRRAETAKMLEGLSILAGGRRAGFEPGLPSRLRAARTCYDHLARALGVQL